MQKLANRSGQSLIEYLLLTALLAIATMGVVRVLGHSVSGKFAQIAKSIQGDHQTKVNFEKVQTSDYSKKDMGDFMTGSQSDNTSGWPTENFGQGHGN